MYSTWHIVSAHWTLAIVISECDFQLEEGTGLCLRGWWSRRSVNCRIVIVITIMKMTPAIYCTPGWAALYPQVHHLCSFQPPGAGIINLDVRIRTQEPRGAAEAAQITQAGFNPGPSDLEAYSFTSEMTPCVFWGNVVCIERKIF